MDCKNAQTLNRRLPGSELDPVRTLEIEDHLHECAVCSQSYKDHQVLSEGLRTGSVYFKAPAGSSEAHSAGRAPSGQSRVRPSMAVLVVG